MSQILKALYIDPEADQKAATAYLENCVSNCSFICSFTVINSFYHALERSDYENFDIIFITQDLSPENTILEKKREEKEKKMKKKEIKEDLLRKKKMKSMESDLKAGEITRLWKVIGSSVPIVLILNEDEELETISIIQESDGKKKSQVKIVSTQTLYYDILRKPFTGKDLAELLQSIADCPSTLSFSSSLSLLPTSQQISSLYPTSSSINKTETSSSVFVNSSSYSAGYSSQPTKKSINRYEDRAIVTPEPHSIPSFVYPSPPPLVPSVSTSSVFSSNSYNLLSSPQSSFTTPNSTPPHFISPLSTPTNSSIPPPAFPPLLYHHQGQNTNNYTNDQFQREKQQIYPPTISSSPKMSTKKKSFAHTISDHVDSLLMEQADIDLKDSNIFLEDFSPLTSIESFDEDIRHVFDESSMIY